MDVVILVLKLNIFRQLCDFLLKWLVKDIYENTLVIYVLNIMIL